MKKASLSKVLQGYISKKKSMSVQNNQKRQKKSHETVQNDWIT